MNAWSISARPCRSWDYEYTCHEVDEYRANCNLESAPAVHREIYLWGCYLRKPNSEGSLTSHNSSSRARVQGRGGAEGIVPFGCSPSGKPAAVEGRKPLR